MNKLNSHYLARIEAALTLPWGEERTELLDKLVEELEAVATSIRCEYRGCFYLGEEIVFADGSILHESRLKLMPTNELIDYAREERWSEPCEAQWEGRPDEDDWD